MIILYSTKWIVVDIDFVNLPICLKWSSMGEVLPCLSIVNVWISIIL